MKLVLIIVFLVASLIKMQNLTQQISLFDSMYSYLIVNPLNKTKDGYKIQLTRNYDIEIILPVYDFNKNMTILIPFLIDSNQEDTTLSQKSMQKIGFDNVTTNYSIFNKTFLIKNSTENKIGRDFLKDCILAVDYANFKASLQILSNSKPIFTYNWPLESFKDVHSEKMLEKINKNYNIGKDLYTKEQAQHAEEINTLTKTLKQRDKVLSTLIQKKEQLRKESRKKKSDL